MCYDRSSLFTNFASQPATPEVSLSQVANDLRKATYDVFLKLTNVMNNQSVMSRFTAEQKNMLEQAYRLVDKGDDELIGLMGSLNP